MQDTVSLYNVEDTYIDNYNNLENIDNSDTLSIESTDSTDINIGDSIFYSTEESNMESAQSENSGRIINVDNDFGGDLNSAIASANNGDVVSLGNRRYSTNGIVLNKAITIDGQEASVVDGGGTSESVFKVTAGASNATIKDLEITNGNNGVAGDGAANLTLKNLNINNIGKSQTNRYGQNNTAISLSHADGLEILDSEIYNVGRKGIGVGDTSGATIDNVTVKNVNLDAQHAQSHDAAGIKFYNTNNVTVKNSYLSEINANHIWNDTANKTTIEGNTIVDVGGNFIAPGFNNNVDISGIYDEKSHNSTVRGNTVNAQSDFAGFNATAFTTQTILIEANSFSSMEVNTTDYWTNQEAETLIATTENPDEANFGLFSTQYYATANIG